MRLIDADELLTDPYFQDESIPERELFIEAVEDSPIIDVMPKWISAYTQLPNDGQCVLTIDADGNMEVLYYNKEYPNAFCGCGGLLKVYNITHWMPLPTSCSWKLRCRCRKQKRGDFNGNK